MPYTVYVYGIFILGYVTIFSRRCAELCGKAAVEVVFVIKTAQVGYFFNGFIRCFQKGFCGGKTLFVYKLGKCHIKKFSYNTLCMSFAYIKV